MKLNLPLDLSGVKTQTDLQNFISQMLKTIVDAINGNLAFGDNVFVSKVSATFASANTQVQVSHGLGVVPKGYIVAGRTANFTVFNGTSTNTSSNIFLQASGAGTATLLVF